MQEVEGIVRGVGANILGLNDDGTSNSQSNFNIAEDGNAQILQSPIIKSLFSM